MNNPTIKSRVSKAAELFTDNPESNLKGLPKEDVEKDIGRLLGKMGIDDSTLGLQILDADSTTFEDLLEVCKDQQASEVITFANVSKPRLKVMWAILKGEDPFKKEEKTEESDIYRKSVTKSIGQWNDLELLEAYGRNCPFDIENELKKRTHGRPAIIFDELGKVDQEKSLYLVRQARYRYTPSTYKINETMHKVYAVSEFTEDVVFECPVHSNIILTNGYCEECGRRWDTEDYDRNVVLRLISESEDIDIRPYKGMEISELNENFPKVFLKYNELKEEGKLPSLKHRRSSSRNGDPFRAIHKTY